MTNTMIFHERPAEYKAMQFDTLESAFSMADWLREYDFKHVRLIDPLNGIDYPYIELDGHKVYVGSYVVVDPDGRYTILESATFEERFVPKYRAKNASTVNVQNPDTAGYDKHDEIVAVNENPEIITNVPVFDEPLKDSNDVGSFISGIWYPRYFQTLGSNSKFFIGEKNGSISMIAKSDIPQGHMAYPISWENATRLLRKA